MTSASGQIISFYSYKGGAGRSMALANIAWLLAKSGKRVLAIDWDMEAPGLYRYFRPFLTDSDLASSDGIIDFVTDYCLRTLEQFPSKELEQAGGIPAEWGQEQAGLLEAYTTSLEASFPGNGGIDFVPSGRQGPEYSTRVNTFDWQRFYDRFRGGALLDAIRGNVKAQYDFVLVDSRTGVSDTSGICTLHLPDTLAVCYTMNNQSIEGLQTALSSIKRQREQLRRSIRVFPIAMRIDLGDMERLNRRREYTRERLAPFLTLATDAQGQKYWDDVEVLYVPLYSYEETLAAFEDSGGDGSVLKAYQRIAQYLTGAPLSPAAPDTSDRNRVQAYDSLKAVTVEPSLARLKVRTLPSEVRVETPADSTDFGRLPEQELQERAVRVLQGERIPQDTVFRMARVLKSRWKRFGLARKVLWLARSESTRITNRRTDTAWMRKLAQQHALCTYKDQDLPASIRFERALAILRAEDLRDFQNPSAVISQETLGLAGAIAKAQFEAFGQRTYLEQSLSLYERGLAQGTADDGYTGINTAYIHDLLAYQLELVARTTGAISTEAAAHREQARGIRNELLAVLPSVAREAERSIAETPAQSPDGAEDQKDRLYWLLVTIGEASVGAGLSEMENLQTAKRSYSAAAELKRNDWMVESTAMQLSSLVRLLPEALKPTPQIAEQVIGCLVGDNAPGVKGAMVGKVGLALSGGGFRASLFHIGVLARLAEVGMLRHIEYLSCVSGGSIIGAYYYLEIRKLLQSMRDDEIQTQDYIELVQRIETKFLEGVQENLRMLAISDLGTNIGHDILSGALPTERVAELYESLLFTKVDDGEAGSPRYISELNVEPKGWTSGPFRPKEDNWRRRNKVPILVLNATTLNTGHNWQFTAKWMGEPPSTVNNEVDANQRLRRMYYSEAPPDYQKVRLGRAVGSSACVPGLFAPVEFPDLYPEMNVQLVDGGVNDNQGVGSLLDQGCTVMLVSDASGQLADQSAPTARVPSTAFRADEIAQERVRVAQFSDLEARQRSGLLRSLLFLHLKKDLELEPLDWNGCPLPYRASDDAKPAADTGPLTSYGINRNLQRKIAGIRTDLDAFHDVEAWALMTSGYRMTEHLFPAELAGLLDPAPPPTGERWKFLCIAGEMAKASPDQRLNVLLTQSSQRFFKVWDARPEIARQLDAIKTATAIVGLMIFAAVGWYWPGRTLSLLVVLALVFLLRFRWIEKTVIARAFAFGSRLYLRRYNGLYLRDGRYPLRK